MSANVAIPALIIGLSTVFVAFFAIRQWVQWRRAFPKVFYGKVGIRYIPDGDGPVKTWDDFRRCVGACEAVVREHELLSQHTDRIMDFWVEVVPYSKLLTNETCITGYLRGRKSVLPPTSEQEAAEVQRVVGSVKTERLFPFTRPQFIIQVLQIPIGLNVIDVRLRRKSSSPVYPMSKSAFFYEFARRHVPFVMAGNYVSVLSAGDRYDDLERRIRLKYIEFGGQDD